LKPSILALLAIEWLNTSQIPEDRADGDAGERSIAVSLSEAILGIWITPLGCACD
jgi:hypothetical protein